MLATQKTKNPQWHIIASILQNMEQNPRTEKVPVYKKKTVIKYTYNTGM